MFLANSDLSQALDIFVTEFPLGLWETFYSTALATLFAIIIGLPLGVLLVVGDKDGILPLPKPIMVVLNWIINIFRSIPFLILMILVLPLSTTARRLVMLKLLTFWMVPVLLLPPLPSQEKVRVLRF